MRRGNSHCYSGNPLQFATSLAADYPAYALANEVTHTDERRQHRVKSKETG